MRWWVDRGVDGFRMDVINLISKPAELRDLEARPGHAYADAGLEVAHGPRLQEFLREMNEAVGLDRHRLLTVGEMPGSTIADARAITDPANDMLDMVFTFEHVNIDVEPGGGKFDVAPARPRRAQAQPRVVADRSGRRRLELALLGQPRPAPGGVAVRRRLAGVPGGVGEDADQRAARAPRDAVRLPGRRAGDDEHAVRRHLLLRRRRVAELPRPGHRPRARGGGHPGRAGRAQPRQRPDADAVGRHAPGRLHRGHPVAVGQPELRHGQREAPSGPTRARCSTTRGG